jgi:hypothetical protein
MASRRVSGSGRAVELIVDTANFFGDSCTVTGHDGGDHDGNENREIRFAEESQADVTTL